jgi:hypothetical protein
VEVGRLERFVIHDPKRRIIHAPAFRERVLHHALMAALGPVLERSAIADSFACRVGKGVHRARARALGFARRHAWFLALDVRSYFDSIAHSVLLAAIARRCKDPEIFALVARIVGAYATAPGRGLPIGSLTSQHFANFYLGPLDRTAKETLHVPGYLRYMDDLVLFGDDRASLAAAGRALAGFARDSLGLELVGSGSGPVDQPRRASEGLPFLGARITPAGLYPSRRTRRRCQRKLRQYERAYQAGDLTAPNLQRRASALVAVVAAMDCRDWRQRALVRSEVDA